METTISSRLTTVRFDYERYKMYEKKPITEMSEEELIEEIARLQSIAIPSDKRRAAPPRKRDVKPKTRRASWRDELLGSDEP